MGCFTFEQTNNTVSNIIGYFYSSNVPCTHSNSHCSFILVLYRINSPVPYHADTCLFLLCCQPHLWIIHLQNISPSVLADM